MSPDSNIATKKQHGIIWNDSGLSLIMSADFVLVWMLTAPVCGGHVVSPMMNYSLSLVTHPDRNLWDTTIRSLKNPLLSRNLQDIRAEVQSAWNELRQITLKSVYNSMPRHVTE
ncbi:hypothetical protein TNCV_717571 [Trichonephila clavipes]|nr:hypothetical protein TNCV_717571 [Trichonephila clavipes]